MRKKCLQYLLHKGSPGVQLIIAIRAIFKFNNHTIRFMTSKRLERYTKVIEWDHGYLVVMAKYKNIGEVEEYIDLIPILDKLYYNTDEFLKAIKEVRIDYAA